MSPKTKGKSGKGDNADIERLRAELAEARSKYEISIAYIREKTDQLLKVMGTSPLKPEELDDTTLIETDPIGIVSNSFSQILRHLHRTNDKLRFAHREIQAIYDSVGVGVLVLDNKMDIVSYNRKLKDLFFPSTVDVLGKVCNDIVCASSIPKGDCPFHNIFKTGKTIRKSRWKVLDRYFDVVGSPILGEDGKVISIVISYMDVTEQLEAERARIQSEERYRDLFENANDMVQVVAADGALMYVNRAWLDRLGYDESDVKNLSVFDILDPECIDCGPDFRKVIIGERVGRFETYFITNSNEKIIVEGNVSAIIENGDFMGTRGIFRDITERKRAEEVLSAEREKLLVTLRSIGDGVITTDTAGNVTLLNKVAEQLTGWTLGEATGHHISEVFRVFDRGTRMMLENPTNMVLKCGRPMEMPSHMLLVSRAGTEHVIADSVAPICDSESNVIGSVLVFRDVTEKRKVEERLQKSEKIESLGILAGGIAHDFNNFLNSILGNIDIALSYTDQEGPIPEALSHAEKAALRARELTGQLLTFSKGGAPIKKQGRISSVVQESAEFVLSGSNVKAVYSLQDDLWEAEFDGGQISQVINNIVLNAMQAMPDGGKVFIRACNLDAPGRDEPQLPGGRHILIGVRDTGPGIPDEIRHKVFDPYFTTKSGGNGLGLASSYSIIKNHGGLLDLDTPPGGGAEFLIYIPASTGRHKESMEQSKVKLKPSDRGMRILVMDDDDLVRKTTEAMLKRLGYTAVLAPDGDSAFAAYSVALEEGKPFDAVIMDLTIPGGMGGKDLISKLLVLDPRIKGIVSSGYSSDPIMANYKDYGFVGVLVKPFRMKELDAKLLEVFSKTAN